MNGTKQRQLKIAKGRLLIVAHTDRTDKIRIISARKVTVLERSMYEEK
ncbi:MAG: BrnT family toxin [Chloroflexi bacterium]|nr:BrnT family toxin [Chloroflexota bacterium]